MSTREPIKLTRALSCWNLFLSIFSLYGAVRTVPHLAVRILTKPFDQTICEDAQTAYGIGAVGLATQLFILSKIPELLDTAFVILRKKPVIFLHWYHHVTVLLFCWNSYITQSAAGIYFVSMNYSVHAVMYFYYFLMTEKAVPHWFPSWIVTSIQISQMFLGSGIVMASILFSLGGTKNYKPGDCNNDPSNLFFGFVIYSSYLYLFIEFAIRRFFFHKKDKDTKRPKKLD